MWRFDGTNWTFIGGSQTPNLPPYHVGVKNFSHEHTPGARVDGMVAYTKSGVYIFGGYGHDSYYTSDLWKFNNETGWAFWGGRTQSTDNQHGEMRVPSADTIVNSKVAGSMFVDDDENIWIFSGHSELLHGTCMVFYSH